MLMLLFCRCAPWHACRQRIDSKAMSVVGKLPVAPFESLRDFKACESSIH